VWGSLLPSSFRRRAAQPTCQARDFFALAQVIGKNLLMTACQLSGLNRVGKRCGASDRNPVSCRAGRPGIDWKTPRVASLLTPLMTAYSAGARLAEKH